MSKATTDYGEEFTIKTVKAGHAVIPGHDSRPNATVTKSGRTWFAFYDGSADEHNFYAGFDIPGGHSTREEAAVWLLSGRQ